MPIETDTEVVYPLSTKRLVLRPFKPDDFPDFAAYHRLPEVYKYLYCPVPDDATLRRRFDGGLSPAFAEQSDLFRLAIERQNEPGVVGQIALTLDSKKAQQAEFGFILNPSFFGRGYASEAARRMLDLGFQKFQLHRIFARIDTENLASIRLVERLGFRREGHFIENDFYDGKWGDEYIYALLAKEWMSAKGT